MRTTLCQSATLQGDGARLEAGGVGKIGSQRQFWCKGTARRARHQKYEAYQHRHGHKDQYADLKLRPLDVFSAWHGIPLGELELRGYESQRLEDSRRGAIIFHPQARRWPWPAPLNG